MDQVVQAEDAKYAFGSELYTLPIQITATFRNTWTGFFLKVINYSAN